VTDWCIHPAAALEGVPRVGGTKNPDVARVVALAPDLVLANLEENREIDVRRLRERSLCVWVDYPRTVAAAVAQIGWLADLGASERARRDVLDPIDGALARVRSRSGPPRSTFVAVWKRPWMSLSRDTYASDLLAVAGLANVCADAESRYPRIDLTDVARLDPRWCCCPTSPTASPTKTSASSPPVPSPARGPQERTGSSSSTEPSRSGTDRASQPRSTGSWRSRAIDRVPRRRRVGAAGAAAERGGSAGAATVRVRRSRGRRSSSSRKAIAARWIPGAPLSRGPATFRTSIPFSSIQARTAAGAAPASRSAT
jgi:hypothetical protein